MSSTSITYLVGACSGVFSLAAFTAWVVVPAWSAYTRVWERVGALFLTLYVLVTFVGLGVGAGAALIYFWDRF